MFAYPICPHPSRNFLYIPHFLAIKISCHQEAKTLVISLFQKLYPVRTAKLSRGVEALTVLKFIWQSRVAASVYLPQRVIISEQSVGSGGLDRIVYNPTPTLLRRPFRCFSITFHQPVVGGV